MATERAVAVIGAGGHAKVVISTLQAAGIAPRVALDDDPSRWGGAVFGVKIRGPIGSFHGLSFRRAVVAIGDNRERHRLVAELAAGGEIEWEKVVHPSAVVHPSVRLGPGTVVFAGAVIQPDATVGAHAIVNTAASVDHDCQLGDFVHLAPGGRLGGAVTVGEGALLGIGCAVLPGRSVGAWAVVGGGATVNEDVDEGWTVAGTPSRRLDPED